MLIVVCGSRKFDNPLTVTAEIVKRMQQLQPEDEVHHGDAPGTDRIADHALKAAGRVSVPHPANWAVYGSRAGIVRNKELLDIPPGLVIAFWNGHSKGTRHMIDQARKRFIPLELHTYSR